MPTVCNSNQAYQMYNINLSNTTRAKIVAQGFLEYRVKSVTLRFKPSSDTYTQGAGVPYLYYKIDRDMGCTGFSKAAHFQTVGCKAHRFDEKIIEVTFRPSVLTGVADNQPTAGALKVQKPIISPWLATDNDNLSPTVWNPSEIDHMGCTWMTEQAFSTATNIQYTVERIVTYEFRKSATALLTVDPGPTPIDAFQDDVQEVN